MTLEKGAIIKNIKQKPGGWWEGVLTSTGKKGMFPDNFVRVLNGDDKSPVVLRYVYIYDYYDFFFAHTYMNFLFHFHFHFCFTIPPPPIHRDKSDTKNRRFKAVYSYAQNNNDELTLAVGDVIEFLGEVEEGWWRGKLSGKIGVFPSNFVEEMPSTSPILANRRSNNVNSSLTRTGANLSSSKEELSTNEKDAPSLPPKPSKLS